MWVPKGAALIRGPVLIRGSMVYEKSFETNRELVLDYCIMGMGYTAVCKIYSFELSCISGSSEEDID